MFLLGFPTCYVAPSPTTLCRYYNACGLSQCKTTAIEGRVHAVECSPYCKGRQPVKTPTLTINTPQ